MIIHTDSVSQNAFKFDDAQYFEFLGYIFELNYLVQ